MKRLRMLFVCEFVVILASVVIAYITHWRMPISPWVAIPAGTALWAGGFVYTLHLRKGFKEAVERLERPPARKRGYPMIEARAAMHLGVALGFRSWPTLIAAVICLVANLGLAIYIRRKFRDHAGGGAPRRRPPRR